MHIDEDHFNHGAALLQIAEADPFKAINSLTIGKVKFNNAFRINENIGVYLKYATEPTDSHNEFIFTFDKNHREMLEQMVGAVPRFFLVSVCVEARHICCLPYKDFARLVKKRIVAKGEEEEQIQILAILPPGKGFRVYVNMPGKKNKMIKGKFIVPRNAFPTRIFKH